MNQNELCKKDEMGCNILEVGKVVKFDDCLYRIVDIGPRERFEGPCTFVLLGRGVLTKNLRTEDIEYFLEHDLI